MHRRSSPTAASSASGPRSASRPVASMHVVRSASSSSPASSIACEGRDRSGREFSFVVPAQAGTHTPCTLDVAPWSKTALLVVMGQRLRGDDSFFFAHRVMQPSRLSVPPHTRGLKIGLFGGTFDPPHEAHRGACLIAMHRLGLDRVWWLVTPGNPLKDTRGLAPLEQRVAATR